MKKNNEPEIIYLDYAAATPVLPEAQKAMLPFFSDNFYNASALYTKGAEVREALENFRRKVANLLLARSEEIIFTGGGTESLNLAILGIVRSLEKIGKSRGHVITSQIEHPAALKISQALAKEGISVTHVPVNESGFVDVEKIKNEIRDDTLLVSIMYVNNELGTIQPIKDIAKIVRSERKRRQTKQKNSFPLYFHTDAIQAPCYLPVDIPSLGVDLLSLDGSKIYGPKGSGILFKKTNITLEPVIYGGGQEEGIRGGTENLPLIAGFSKALEIITDERSKESRRLFCLSSRLYEGIKKIAPKASLNGDMAKRVPGILNICFPNHDAEFLLFQLGFRNIAVSLGSACKNRVEIQGKTTSPVLAALFSENPKRKEACLKSSLRFSFGRGTTEKHIDLTTQALADILEVKI